MTRQSTAAAGGVELLNLTAVIPGTDVRAGLEYRLEVTDGYAWMEGGSRNSS